MCVAGSQFWLCKREMQWRENWICWYLLIKLNEITNESVSLNIHKFISYKYKKELQIDGSRVCGYNEGWKNDLVQSSGAGFDNCGGKELKTRQRITIWYSKCIWVIEVVEGTSTTSTEGSFVLFCYSYFNMIKRESFTMYKHGINAGGWESS